MSKPSKQPTAVVPLSVGAPKLEPPGNLGGVGSDLWRRITNAYRVDDEGSRQLLYECCAMADRAEQLQAEIAADGPIVRTASGELKDHPGLRHELGARSFVVKTLMRMGITLEVVKPSVGWTGQR
jgi:hypothetical protein